MDRLFTEEEIKARRREIVRKGIISDKSVEFNDGEGPHVFPDTGTRQPRGVDSGVDAMGRDFQSSVMARIAGGFSRKTGGDPDAIPSAGAGVPFEGDTRTASPGKPQRFMPSGEGDAGRAGGEDGHGLGTGRAPSTYAIQAEGMDPGRRTTKIGPNWMLPGKSGIADVQPINFEKAAYDADEDDKKAKGKAAYDLDEDDKKGKSKAAYDADEQTDLDQDDDDQKQKAGPKVVATGERTHNNGSINKDRVAKALGSGLFSNLVHGPLPTQR